jgi:hypothetical protein
VRSLNVGQVGVVEVEIHLIDVEALISVSEITGVGTANAKKLF